MNKKSAKEMMTEMMTLQVALRQTCPHCQQTTLRFITDESCHCVNPLCGAFMLTMEVSQFITMTPETMATYSNCKQSVDSLDDAQTEFEKREAEIKTAAAKRQTARDAGVQVYG